MTTAPSARTVVVTGAGSGIGAAIARMLAPGGGRLVLTGRRQPPLEEVAADVRSAGGEALVLPGDVRDFGHLERLAAAAVERFGSLDVLVANAAVADLGEVARADPALWAEVIGTNVLGVLHAIRAVLPLMLERGTGHIVVVASVSGRVTYPGEPAYVASKHATVAFADCLRQEVTGKGVRVSVIEPGLVETPLIHVWEGAADIVPGVTPLDPTDVARAVRYVLDQPPNVEVFEVVLRPAGQVL
jgi:NADP-dependent 3-hydroxy acid dehydrogenase YdfG